MRFKLLQSSISTLCSRYPSMMGSRTMAAGHRLDRPLVEHADHVSGRGRAPVGPVFFGFLTYMFGKSLGLRLLPGNLLDY